MSPLQTISGLVNIDKPPSLTSHDIVAEVRNILNAKYAAQNIKVGHTGTLDPFATGVLLVAIGSATRLVEYSHSWDKEYKTTFIFGATSNTDDITGTITPSLGAGTATPNKAQIKDTLKQFTGIIKQTPPAYSAIKIKGRKAYELSRQGSRPQLKPRPVTIHGIKIISYQYPKLSLKITCSTGTYIRSLARDLGTILKVGAYASGLCRIRIGTHTIDKSVKLNDFDANSLIKHLLPTTSLIKHLPQTTLSDTNVAQFRNGQPVEQGIMLTNKYSHNQPIAVYDNHQALVGIALLDPTTALLKPHKLII